MWFCNVNLYLKKHVMTYCRSKINLCFILHLHYLGVKLKHLGFYKERGLFLIAIWSILLDGTISSLVGWLLMYLSSTNYQYNTNLYNSAWHSGCKTQSAKGTVLVMQISGPVFGPFYHLKLQFKQQAVDFCLDRESVLQVMIGEGKEKPHICSSAPPTV